MRPTKWQFHIVSSNTAVTPHKYVGYAGCFEVRRINHSGFVNKAFFALTPGSFGYDPKFPYCDCNLISLIPYRCAVKNDLQFEQRC